MQKGGSMKQVQTMFETRRGIGKGRKFQIEENIGHVECSQLF